MSNPGAALMLGSWCCGMLVPEFGACADRLPPPPAVSPSLALETLRMLTFAAQLVTLIPTVIDTVTGLPSRDVFTIHTLEGALGALCKSSWETQNNQVSVVPRLGRTMSPSFLVHRGQTR